MRNIWRWVAIKLLVFSALRKERSESEFKVYRVLPGLFLVGHGPGRTEVATGYLAMCLLGDVIQHVPGRITLRVPGVPFHPSGAIQAIPTPGWTWYLRAGS